MQRSLSELTTQKSRLQTEAGEPSLVQFNLAWMLCPDAKLECQKVFPPKGSTLCGERMFCFVLLCFVLKTGPHLTTLVGLELLV